MEKNVFVPATANPYQYGYAPVFVICLSLVLSSFHSAFHLMVTKVTNLSNAEFGSPMDWYNHPSSLVECLLGNFIHSMYHTTACLVIMLKFFPGLLWAGY